MAGTTSREHPIPYRGRRGIPGFTAGSALGGTVHSYVSRLPRATGDVGEIVPAQVTVSGVSGIYAGIVCAGHTQCVITVDVDENGHVTGSHCVDEIGSC